MTATDDKRVRNLLLALDQLRQAKRLTKAALDDRFGRGRGYHSHLFSGRVRLTVDHLLALLDVFETEWDDFLPRAFEAGQRERAAIKAYAQTRDEALEDLRRRLELLEGKSGRKSDSS